MDNSKKLSEYDIRTVLSMTDLFPSLVDNGDGTYTNTVTPLSAIRTYSAVPSGGTTSQVLQKTNNSDYQTQWHSLVKADIGLGNVDNTADIDKPVSTAVTSAISAAVAATKAALYPVGSIYVNATDNTNPGTLLGFGTWTAFGAGRVPVGYSSGETEFNSSEKTGGEKTHTLTWNEMPAHNHGINSGYGDTGTGDILRFQQWAGNGRGYHYTLSGGQTMSTEGGGQAHNNLQPYITVYMWKRTA